MAELACEVHGPLRPRRQAYSGPEPELVWVCVGFDGEAAGVCTARVPDTARERLASGATYWPGVGVMDGDRYTSWTQARDNLRSA
jgi:hypothetical protein